MDVFSGAGLPVSANCTVLTAATQAQSFLRRLKRNTILTLMSIMPVTYELAYFQGSVQYTLFVINNTFIVYNHDTIICTNYMCIISSWTSVRRQSVRLWKFSEDCKTAFRDQLFVVAIDV